LTPFTGEIRNEWGADQPQHRLKLKKASLTSCHSSVSHCPLLGGYVGLTEAHPALLQIGFDIEEVDRVSPEASERVSNPRDHSIGGITPALQWSAREAAYKCLAGPSQPQVVSQIALTDWKLREHGIFQFQFSSGGLSPGQGYAWCDGDFQFALSLWTPLSQIEKGCRSTLEGS